MKAAGLGDGVNVLEVLFIGVWGDRGAIWQQAKRPVERGLCGLGLKEIVHAMVSSNNKVGSGVIETLSRVGACIGPKVFVAKDFLGVKGNPTKTHIVTFACGKEKIGARRVGHVGIVVVECRIELVLLGLSRDEEGGFIFKWVGF